MDLDTPIERAFRTLPNQLKALHKLRVRTVFDLLMHFPVRYGTTSEIKNIGSLIQGESAVVFGTLTGLKTSKGFKTKIAMSEAWLTDETGRIKIVWFNQPYIAKMLSEGATVRVDGKISQKKDSTLYFSNPKIEITEKVPLAVGKNLFGEQGEEHVLYPIYSESRGVTSNWMYHNIERIFKSGILDSITDPIPEDILEKYNLPKIATALVWIHAPKRENDALAARKRFAFQEIFFIQLERQRERALWKKEKAFDIISDKKSLDTFISHFPFKATNAQEKSIKTILEDFASGQPMARLLEGDVGSGKTAVAAATMFAVINSRPKGKEYGNLQVAYMAPTEILAKQQFENFIEFFKHSNTPVALITGSGCRKFPSKLNKDIWTSISKTQLSKWVGNGEIPIVIGTHALISKSIHFKHLAYVIIDEQHRFGTAQRQKLTEKNTVTSPHLLSMTATPIPRTLSLTLYGDLDISLLDQMPVGRKPVITKLVLPQDRNAIYIEIKKQLREGRQLYIICPRINEPDPTKELAVMAKSVTEEAKHLQDTVFKDWNIGILHSKMTATEKEKSMLDFAEHKTDILVATSVVEVGVNVPNATMIVIEGVERFGLSQLHQLRGRVIRSNHQAYCYVFSESSGDKTVKRLRALSTAKNGFELAEFDLSQRGAGELYGGKQWGVSDLAMDALQNIRMVEAAREEAKRLISEDIDLERYPLLKQHLDKSEGTIHFE
jgi:ATP-dependent DNA helicase RecG